VGAGRYRVSGDLGFDSVADLWKQSLAQLDGSTDPIVDLSQVSHVDSAGLALIIEWVRWAHGNGVRLQLIKVPEKVLALARISEIDGFLAGALGPA
jgi:phospholipid transport system transporter-binding protein